MSRDCADTTPHAKPHCWHKTLQMQAHFLCLHWQERSLKISACVHADCGNRSGVYIPVCRCVYPFLRHCVLNMMCCGCIWAMHTSYGIYTGCTGSVWAHGARQMNTCFPTSNTHQVSLCYPGKHSGDLLPPAIGHPLSLWYIAAPGWTVKWDIVVNEDSLYRAWAELVTHSWTVQMLCSMKLWRMWDSHKGTLWL